MNLYKKIIAIQLVLILQIFASDPLSGEDGAIKDSTSEAFTVLSAGIADIGQLVDINTGYPTQNGWSMVRVATDAITDFYTLINNFTCNRISRTALCFLGFATNVDRALSHAFHDTKSGQRYFYVKTKTAEFYRCFYQNIYADTELCQ